MTRAEEEEKEEASIFAAGDGRRQAGRRRRRERRSKKRSSDCGASLLAIAESNDKIGRLLSDAATIHPRRRRG